MECLFQERELARFVLPAMVKQALLQSLGLLGGYRKPYAYIKYHSMHASGNIGKIGRDIPEQVCISYRRVLNVMADLKAGFSPIALHPLSFDQADSKQKERLDKTNRSIYYNVITK